MADDLGAAGPAEQARLAGRGRGAAGETFEVATLASSSGAAGCSLTSDSSSRNDRLPDKAVEWLGTRLLHRFRQRAFLFDVPHYIQTFPSLPNVKDEPRPL